MARLRPAGFTFAAAVVLSCLAAVALASARPAAPGLAGAPAKPAASGKPADSTKPAPALVFRGQALGPDLKPVAGARATLVATPPESSGSGMGWGPRDPGEKKKIFVEAVANEEGRFEAALPSAGPWNLRVSADALAPTIVERVRASSVSSPVYLQPGLSLRGTVHDIGRRTPVEGAKVVAVPVLDKGFDDPEEPERFAVIASSTREGGFTLTHLPANFYRLLVTAPAHALGYVGRQPVDATKSEPVAIFLEPGFSITGRVLDREGKGIAGVDLSVTRVFPRRLRMDSFAAMNSLRTRSDESGRFEIAGVPIADSMSVTARAPDGSRARKPIPVTGSRTALSGMDLVLDRPATLTAILQDADGKPVRKASVDIEYESERGRSGPGDRFSRASSAVSVSETGRLKLGEVPSGSGAIEISADGFKSWSLEESVLKPGETLDLGTLTFERGRTISGRVLDAGGQPLEDVTVRAQAFTGTGMLDAETKTAADGTYLLGGLGDPRMTVIASREGLARAEKSEVAPDSTGIDFRLERAGSLAGRVTAGDPPQPLSSFSVRAAPKEEGGRGGGMRFSMGGSERSRDFSDPRGRFSLPGLTPGTYTLEVMARGLLPAMRQDVVVTAAEAVELGDFFLAAGARVTGKTVDRDGAPVAGAAVSIRSGGTFSFGPDDTSPSASSGLDGRFTLAGLQGGSQTLVAEHPEFAKAETTVRVDPAVPGSDVTLTLPRGGRIAGVIRDDAGSPLPGATVIALMMSDPMGASPVQSDDGGRFAFENLRAGTYSVSKVGGGAGSGGRRTMFIGAGMDSKQAEVKDGETTTVSLGGDQKTIRVHGTVRKAGGTVASARMFWIATKESGPVPEAMRSATTEPSGAYEVNLPQAGTYTVRVSEEGAAMTAGTTFSVTVPEGTTDLSKDLVYPIGVVSGMVLRASDNTPVDGATVSAVAEDAASSGSPSPWRRGESSARTDATGRYRLEGLAEGTYKLSASGAGMAPSVSTGVRVKGDGEGQADFALRPGSALRVRVIDPDGRPLRGAMLLPLDDSGTPEGNWRNSATTGADGTAVVDGLLAGPCTLLAISRDMAPTIRTGLEAPESGEAAAEIQVPAAGALDLKVVDADGAPVAGLVPALVDPSGVKLDSLMPTLRMMSGLPSSTGKDGKMSFPFLAPGKQTVSVAQGSLKASGTVNVIEGKTASLQLTLK